MEILVILLGVVAAALLAQFVALVHLAIQGYKYDRVVAKIKRATRKADEVAGKHKSEIGG